MLAGGMALGKSLNLPGLSFPCCKMEIIITAAHQDVVGELNGLNPDEVHRTGLSTESSVIVGYCHPPAFAEGRGRTWNLPSRGRGAGSLDTILQGP